MKIIEIKGNLLDSKSQIIVHQTNTQCSMGAGVAKMIKEKWPLVYHQYALLCKAHSYAPESLLGNIQLLNINEGQKIVNLFAQNTLLPNKCNTDYDAFKKGIHNLVCYCKSNNIESVAFPYKIGCGLGGGDWDKINTIIQEGFKDTDTTIEYWIYDN